MYANSRPQALKRESCSRIGGTTEVVPFPFCRKPFVASCLSRTLGVDPHQLAIFQLKDIAAPDHRVPEQTREPDQHRGQIPQRQAKAISFKTWRSRNTDHPTTSATATRRARTRPARPTTRAHRDSSTRANTAQGNPKVSTSPRYPPAPRIADGASPAQLMVQKLAQRVGGKKCFDHYIGQLHSSSPRSAMRLPIS